MPWNRRFLAAANPEPTNGIADKSFACRAAAHGGDFDESVGTFGETLVGRDMGKVHSLYKSTTNDSKLSSVRFKIDNHVDTMLTTTTDSCSRGSVGSLFDIGLNSPPVIRPLPAALVDDLRSPSDCS